MMVPIIRLIGCDLAPEMLVWRHQKDGYIFDAVLTDDGRDLLIYTYSDLYLAVSVLTQDQTVESYIGYKVVLTAEPPRFEGTGVFPYAEILCEIFENPTTWYENGTLMGCELRNSFQPSNKTKLNITHGR